MIALLILATSQMEFGPYILLANWRFIHQLSLDGSQERTIVSDPFGNIYAMDYRYRSMMMAPHIGTLYICMVSCLQYRLGQLYWHDVNDGKLMRSNLDGSQPSAILNEPPCYIGTHTISL